MELSYPELELDAPILPNEGLGGWRLRAKLSEMQHSLSGLGITKAGSFKLVSPFDARYFLGMGEVAIAVDIRNGKIFMLSAGKGYKGALFRNVFVGMKVKDALVLEPRLYYDEAEEMLLCKGCLGVSIDISEIDPPLESVPETTITAINVFAEETRSLQGQEGKW